MQGLPARRMALLFLAIGSISFGFSGVLIKLCGFPPSVIASGRMLLAGAVLTPLSLPGLGRLLRERRLAGLLLLVLPGLLLGLHFQSWVIGLKRTSMASATFIFSINPVFFALFERLLFRRTVRASAYVSLAMVLSGATWLLAVKGGRLGQIGTFSASSPPSCSWCICWPLSGSRQGCRTCSTSTSSTCGGDCSLCRLRSSARSSPR